MKHHLLFVLAFLWLSLYPLSSQAQVRISGYDASMPMLSPIDTLDQTKLCVHYQYRVVEDIRNPKKITQYNLLLQIGSQLSKFSDYNDIVGDSIVREEVRQGVNNNTILLGMLSRRNGQSSYNEEVFKNSPKGKYSVEEFLMGEYIYEEPIPTMEWTVDATADTTLLGYACTRATCHFRGRNYIAWFAPDIAIDNGPWKFHGLPGLILQVEDDEHQHIYTCTALYQPQGENPIYKKKRTNVVKTTREKFLKAKKRAMDDLILTLQNSGKFNIKLPPNAPKKRRSYNPIERE
ncbi:MAG: GLPGLI family protein [Mediterranea sp.]|jgi:GLPGLI family protein|nr:GLPGLI family protein [Mediterranea sp.]